MASVNVITDIESKTKVNRFFTFRTLILFIAYMLISHMFSGYVNTLMYIPYMIFSGVCCLFLILPSLYNMGRNNLESIIILFKSDKKVYRPYISPEEVIESVEGD